MSETQGAPFLTVCGLPGRTPGSPSQLTFAPCVPSPPSPHVTIVLLCLSHSLRGLFSVPLERPPWIESPAAGRPGRLPADVICPGPFLPAPAFSSCPSRPSSMEKNDPFLHFSYFFIVKRLQGAHVPGLGQEGVSGPHFPIPSLGWFLLPCTVLAPQKCSRRGDRPLCTQMCVCARAPLGRAWGRGVPPRQPPTRG